MFEVSLNLDEIWCSPWFCLVYFKAEAIYIELCITFPTFNVGWSTCRIWHMFIIYTHVFIQMSLWLFYAVCIIFFNMYSIRSCCDTKLCPNNSQQSKFRGYFHGKPNSFSRWFQMFSIIVSYLGRWSNLTTFFFKGCFCTCRIICPGEFVMCWRHCLVFEQKHETT